MIEHEPVDWRQWVRAIERIELEERSPGNVNGPIGMVGVELARQIALRSRGGTCDASPAELAEAVARARSAVNQAIARLSRLGFLVYQPGARGRPASFRLALP